MKKAFRPILKSLAFTAVLFRFLPVQGQEEASRIPMTAQEAKSLYATANMQRVSVHDPSIVYDEENGLYYVFGSHMAAAKTRDLQNWTSVTFNWGKADADGNVAPGTADPADAFHFHLTRKVTIGGEEKDFGNFDAAAWNCALPGEDDNGAETDWTVDGNMWAPDVIYNPALGKWCQYLSLNGPKWNSCIILLTADRIEGPYVYQAPVVFTGFRNDTDERISFHKTDLELVIGEQESLPARYRQEKWGDYWPHAIDPCVFYDEEGKLWMSYGSWSGGIYILRLNPETGLRDYDIKYESDFDAKKTRVTSDPYFGKKIAGGCYVSGEGSYIEHIGNYYYLFLSYGGLAPDGGYDMRVFRSENPDGPYKDMRGTDAIFTDYSLNYGPNADNRGEKLLGAYNRWGFMDVGECAQGHNSVLAAADGRTYLVYHTKFNNGTPWHEVRVHQLYLNSTGWLVAAPFEYHGETAGDGQIASSPAFGGKGVAGHYHVLLHPYGLNHESYEESVPAEIVLGEDGKIEGAYTGTWTSGGDNSYITLKLEGGATYQGVLTEQQMEPTTIKAVCFTASGTDGTSLWGYRMEDNYALAYTLNINASGMPVKDGQVVTRHVDLYGMERETGVDLKWESDQPDIISNTGRYDPTGLAEDVPVELTGELSCGDYFWNETFHVTARKETTPSGDWLGGMRAYYGFDMEPFTNAYDTSQEARLSAQGGNKRPSTEKDSLRTGNILHQYFGAGGQCSYVQMPNPLRDETLEGMTVSLWVKRTDDVPWDAVWAFYDAAANSRLYLTGNSYVGFNNGTDWFDINHPDDVISNHIPVGQWCLVTLTVSRTDGCVIYVDGNRVRDAVYRGSRGGTSVANAKDFDYNLVMDFIQSCPRFYLGYGSFWGSADVRVDDLILYGRALEATDVRALNTMSNRVTDFSVGGGGTSVGPVYLQGENGTPGTIYDLSGRPVKEMRKGIYIVDGHKVVVP